MTLFEFLVLLLVAGIAGAIAQAMTGFSRGGCLAAIGFGFLGSLVGLWLARELGLPTVLTLDIGGTAFPLVWAILGAAICVTVVSAVSRR